MVHTTFTCPCCGYKTLSEQTNGSYEICQVCFWEDDPMQCTDPTYEGGANSVSLRQAQQNYIAFGACEKEMIKHVRQPRTEEQRDEQWKPME